MRYTIIHGIDDGIKIDLGSDTGIIGAVMQIGRAKDSLTCEAELFGDELLVLLQKFPIKAQLLEQINPQNKYVITSYDW